MSDGARALDVDGQNHLDHQAHQDKMLRLAVGNGLEQAPGGGLCGNWLQFRTASGLHCSKGPMLEEMFTTEQLTPTPAPRVAMPSPKVTCISNGTDGKRLQLVYARRSSHTDHHAAMTLEMQSWAQGIDEILMSSAHKTDGSRRGRWATDSTCAAKILNVAVPNTVTTFAQLVSALEAKGLTAASRKYLVMWDDGDSTAKFCGLGETYPDSTPGGNNLNERQASGAQFAAVEGSCSTHLVAAHELMHTLGAVQANAPHATGYGHCTDESDIMCYVDGPGSVMTSHCDTSQENLYDCNDDDYFNTNPKPGKYLATHWNSAMSGWLDRTVAPIPPGMPQAGSLTAGSGSVTAHWTAPVMTGGVAVQAYEVTLSTGPSKVVPASTTSATITGLAHGVSVLARITAINAAGAGEAETTNSVTPTPPVKTLATTPDGQGYGDIASGPAGSVYLSGPDSIVAVAANGAQTTVVHGPGSGEGTPPLQTTVHPTAIATGANGDLFWYDSVLGTIRRLHGGVVTTVAGNGAVGTAGDGGSALSASLRVTALAVGVNSTTVHVLDKTGNAVRTFTVGGTISTTAGVTGVSGSDVDHTLATKATFNGPSDIAAASSGLVYVADTGNDAVRAYILGGTLDTVAGNGSTTLNPAPSVSTTTGVPAPVAIGWSPDKRLLIESGGVIRWLDESDFSPRLKRIAGDPFTAGASDADGTLAASISYRKTDSVKGIAWSSGILHVLTAGPNPTTSATRNRLRSAGPYLVASPAVVPSALVVAPKATAGKQAATVTWVPATNGGGEIYSYDIVASPGGAVKTASGTATKATFAGLKAGTSYRFTVYATSDAGQGPASATSNAVVPSVTSLYRPFTSWSSFVVRQYLEILARGPTSSESSKAVTALTAGTTTKAKLIESLRRSTENTTNVDPVARLYRAFLDRIPDASGLKFWIGRRRTGNWNLTRMADSFATSSEFTAKYGTLTNRQFVTRIYTDVLGRTADPSGVDYWTKKLDTKAKTRGAVMAGFSESSEYQRNQVAYTDVAVAYVFLLDRSPDEGESESWRNNAPYEAYTVLVDEILGSDEYAVHIAG